MTQKELREKIKALGKINLETKKSIICSLIGHSRICTGFFGYRYCGRCNEQLGDSLGSFDPENKKAVLVGHNCEVCKKNWKKCTWKDKLFCKDPFKHGDDWDEKYKKAPYLKTL